MGVINTVNNNLNQVLEKLHKPHLPHSIVQRLHEANVNFIIPKMEKVSSAGICAVALIINTTDSALKSMSRLHSPHATALMSHTGNDRLS